MNKFVAAGLSLAAGLCLSVPGADAQQAPVNLRSDSTFAIVAGNPAVMVNGSIYAGGSVASQAQADFTTAYNDAAGRSVAPISLSGNIGGLTLVPALCKSTSSLSISSRDLTLDAQGNPNAVWIFQIASTLATTSGLAPGLARLYQVNAVVPAGVTPGNAVLCKSASGT